MGTQKKNSTDLKHGFGVSGARSVQEFFEPDYTTDFLDSESELTDAEFNELMRQDVEDSCAPSPTLDEIIALELATTEHDEVGAA